MTNVIQTSLAAGMLSARLRGRVDLQQYPAGAEDLTNVQVQTQGGASKRAGTYFIAAGPSTRVRLVPFLVSSAVAYVLEFSNLALRIYRNRAQLLDGGSAPISVATLYATADLRALKFAQSADVLYIFHPGYQPQKLSRVGDVFTLSPVRFENGPYDAENTGDVGAAPPSATGSATTAGSGSSTASGSGAGDGPDLGSGVSTGSGGEGEGGDGAGGGEAEGEGGEGGADSGGGPE
jgi:hypothetical protein